MSVEDLTPAERHVLATYAIEGSVVATAARLRISQHTLKNHLTSAYRKLGVSGRAQGALAAFRLLGWIHVPEGFNGVSYE